MVNTVTTNGIIMTVPTTQQSGPAYAQEITNLLINDIAGHRHSGTGDGYQIELNEQVISGDLNLDGFNLDNAKSVRLESLSHQPSGSQDVNAAVNINGNLGWINQNKILVLLTNGNEPAGGGGGAFTNWTPVSINSNTTILTTDTFNLLNVNTSSSNIVITLPVAAAITPTAAGRLYLIRDISNNAQAHPITIQCAGGSGNVFGDGGITSINISANGGYIAIETDGNNKWFSWSQNVIPAGSNLTIQGSGTLQAQSGSTVNLLGTRTFFTDNNPPRYQNAQTRSVIQPLIVINGVASTGGMATGTSTRGSYEVTSTDQYFYPLTKIINGATMSSITFAFMTGGTAPTSGSAAFNVYAISLVGPTQTLIATYNIPTSGLATNTYFTASVSVAGAHTSPVDDVSVYYTVDITGDGSVNYFVFPCIITYTNITQIGQI